VIDLRRQDNFPRKQIMRSLIPAGAFIFLLLACSNVGRTAQAIVAGKVKSVDWAKHEFVVTETAGKDRLIKLDDNVFINRGGRESPRDLKSKDSVCVSCDKDAVVWTANYILVQEGDAQNWSLAHGNVERYDPEKKEVSYEDDQGRTWTFSTIDAKVYVNRVESKFESVKIGERVLALLQKSGDRNSLKNLYITRK